MVDPYYPSGGISCFNLEGRGFIELKGVQIGLPKKNKYNKKMILHATDCEIRKLNVMKYIGRTTEV